MGDFIWTAAEESATMATVCGFLPYQEVQCDIKAYNEAGDSEVASPSAVRTDCAGECKIDRVIKFPSLHHLIEIIVKISAPSSPRDLEITTPVRVNDSTRYRWIYTASWQVRNNV